MGNKKSPNIFYKWVFDSSFSKIEIIHIRYLWYISENVSLPDAKDSFRLNVQIIGSNFRNILRTFLISPGGSWIKFFAIFINDFLQFDLIWTKVKLFLDQFLELWQSVDVDLVVVLWKRFAWHCGNWVFVDIFRFYLEISKEF